MGKSATASNGRRQGRLEGLFERAVQVAERIPGSERVRERLEQAETRALKLLKSRMDRVAGPRALPAPAGSVQAGGTDHPAADSRTHSAREMLLALLAIAGEQKGEQAREALFVHLLSQLLPDEARMLSALSDGSSYALVHVGVANPMGVVAHRLMENLSSVGKACQVRLPDQVPEYIRHLRELGLVETAAENKALDVKYQVLESDSKVMELERQAKHKLRFIRRSLRISALGKALWTHCLPETAEADD